MNQMLNAYGVLLKRLKKPLLKAIFLSISAFFLFPGVAVFATNANTAQPQVLSKTQEQIQIEQMITGNGVLKVISEGMYLLLWPLVALAGLAMDNSLVYGSFINLDAPLRKIWTIVKNLTNFILGFVFLTGILMYALSPQKSWIKGISSPGDLIKKTLIAGVLVQLSWFVMMVAVDISTVLTYTVGGLPTTLLAQTNTEMDTKVMGLSVLMDFGPSSVTGTREQNEALKTYVTLPSIKEGGAPLYIAPCKQVPVITQNGTTGFMALLGRAYPSLKNGDKSLKMQQGYCFFNGDIYSYKEWTKDETFAEDRSKIAGNINNPEIKQAEYAKMKDLYQAFDATTTGQINVSNGCNYFGKVPKAPQALGSGSQLTYSCIYNEYGVSLSSLTEKATSRTGPFMALYGNMIHFARADNALGIKQSFMILALNTVFLGLLILPLVAMVGVLFWRVLQLWIAIALSPLIVLKEVFSDLWGKGIKDALDFLDFGEIVKLLFAPVFIAFALSISLMFVSILKGSLNPQLQMPQVSRAISELTGMECSETTCTLLGFIRVTLSSEIIDIYWFIFSIVGIALTWFLLFAAIKVTKFGSSFGGKLQEIGESAFRTMPIIPVPSKNTAIGLGALQKMPETITSGYKRQLEALERDDLAILSGDNSALYKRHAEQFFNGETGLYGTTFASFIEKDHKSKLDQLKALKEKAGTNNDRITLAKNFGKQYYDAISRSQIDKDKKNKAKEDLESLWSDLKVEMS